MMMLEPSAPRIPAGSGVSLPALRFTRPQSCVSRADATSWQMKGAKLTTAVIPLPSPPATATEAWLAQAAGAGRGLAGSVAPKRKLVIVSIPPSTRWL